MPAPATIDDFLAVVKKSGVLDDQRIGTYLQSLRDRSSLPVAPRLLAEQMVRDGVLTNFQMQQLMLGKFLGFRLGHYNVLELLGSGGMSAVYLCEHQEQRFRVAIKVLPRQLAKDPTMLKRFYREARASARLNHPNIARGYEVNQEKDQHYFVMEWVDGTSLQEIVKKHGPLSIERACHYVQQAANGLQYANEAGLVHRDIKPGNLLINREGTVKVLDMGLSRFANDEESVLTKDVLGTLDYLAPEQAKDSHAVDIRADIYSLGGTFYFLLTGETPYGKDALDPTTFSGIFRAPKPIRSLRAEAPEELTTIISKMMALDRMKRYQTPGEIAKALEPWTQTPLAPPSELEMPYLSLAARGNGVPPVPSTMPSWGSMPESIPSLFKGTTSSTVSPPRKSRKFGWLIAAFVLAAAGGITWYLLKD